ncbi:MAG: hypothetical protein SWN98_03390 [Pseudomonadota bacterium]|nr:hypothetical protein [Pseudomonadota bacterium]
MRSSLKTFLAAEDGAVTVDWVVLTAAVVGLAFAVMVIFNNGPANLATTFATKVGAISVKAGD